MKYLDKEKELINQTAKDIQSIITKQLNELMKWDSKRSFIELELDICKKLNEIGAKLLEHLIPNVFGDGYIGPRRDINIDSEYDEDKISYRCETRNKTRGLKTIFGKIKISRAIYSEYYSGGQKSFLDEQLDIENKRNDPLSRYWTDLLGTIAPFNEASDILNKIRGIKVSSKQVELSTEKMAKKITDIHNQQIEHIVLDDKGRVPAAIINLNLNAKRTVYIETDGCMINTHNDWKECKTFMLFEIEQINNNEYKLKNKKYFSTMNNVNELKRQLKYHLEQYCEKDEVRIVCVSDGAKWIWNSIKELFPEELYPSGIVEIIDYYHSVEKIGDIKNEIFKDDKKGEAFYNECKEYIKKGNIEIIEQLLEKLRDEQISDLGKQIVDEKLKYFINNKNRMRYDKFKTMNLCIGSGAIESANKFVVQRRVKLQGMKWEEDNANFMVHLRAEYINNQMDVHYGIKDNPLIDNIAVT